MSAVVRRGALLTIAAAAIYTAAVGAFIAVVVIVDPGTDAPGWRLFFGIAGVAAAAVGGTAAWLVLRDLRAGVITRQAERWTWAATAFFAVGALVSVWYAFLAILGPITTAVAVRVARGRRRSGGAPVVIN